VVSRATGLANDGDKGDVTTTVRLRQAFRSIFLHMPDFVQRRFLLTKHLLNTPLFILSPLFLHSFPPHSHSNFYASPTVELLWKFRHVGNLPTPRQNSITVFLSLANLHYSQTHGDKLPCTPLFPFPTNLHYSQTHRWTAFTLTSFPFPTNLHYSQTVSKVSAPTTVFPFPTNLHYSQTAAS
jgi:hypothetical protein